MSENPEQKTEREKTTEKLVQLLLLKESRTSDQRKLRQSQREAQRLKNEARHGYPKAPNPTTLYGWVMKGWNWVLRRYGKKRGEVHDFWSTRSFTILELKRQEKCPHFKGMVGYRSRFTPHFDYNVYQHTFIDGSSRIKCHTCSWEVWNKSEFSLKWKEGLRMVNLSSNLASSSEVVRLATPYAPTPTTDPFWRKTAENQKNPIVGLNVTDEDYKAAVEREKAQKDKS